MWNVSVDRVSLQGRVVSRRKCNRSTRHPLGQTRAYRPPVPDSCLRSTALNFPGLLKSNFMACFVRVLSDPSSDNRRLGMCSGRDDVFFR